MTAGRPLIFISYSHKDEAWKDHLVSHLKVLQYQDSLQTWDDRQIKASQVWYQEIETALKAASVALLLISRHSLTSEFILKEEVSSLLKHSAAAGVRLFAVIVSPCAWQTIPWLARFQVRPKDGRPLSGGTPFEIDTDLLAIAQEVDELCRGAGLPPSPPTFIPLPPRHIYPPRLPAMIHRRLVGRDAELAWLTAAWENPSLNIVSLVAPGGVGKTALVQQWLLKMQAQQFRGAARFYGVSFYSQGSREEAQASADPFIAHALKWFGDPDPTQGSPWDRGARLAELINDQRTLLVLDGLEPLQSPPVTGEPGGKLKDQALAGLLNGLAYANQGLCLITTRLPVQDLELFTQTDQDGVQVGPVRSHDLGLLSKEAGAQLLADLGVKGLPGELEQAALEFRGHALALSLLGTYLKVAKQGDIRKRGEIEILKEQGHGADAQKLMAAYARWFAGKPALEILFLLGLFDCPAAGEAIAALKAPPPIPGLTEKFPGLSADDWHYALEDLRQALLLDPVDPNHPGTLDCHPLIREYFGARLKKENPEAWRAAHSRLYEYYKTQAPEFPDTLEAMLPLFAAVAHGCQAGRHQETLDEVYWSLILRKNEFFSTKKLGAFGAELAALAGFFDPPWRQAVPALRENWQAFVLGEAAFDLRALGRLAEAVPPMQASLKARISQKSWANAAIAASNLSELSMTLGRLVQAAEYARQAVALADKSADDHQKIASRTTLAWVFFLQGRLSATAELFEEAEMLQQQNQPEYPFLYSQRGFKYCQLLLSRGQYREVMERAGKTVELVSKAGWLLDIALDHLSLGQAYLRQSLAEGSPDLTSAATHLHQAMAGLRQAGEESYVVQGLLVRAGLYRVLQDWPHAHCDLQEAMARATRGGMALHQADAHLEYARLQLAQGDTGPARQHLTTAKQMITAMGYHRRDQEVQDLETQLSAAS
ncbi:MAG: TIR domain-containing protein [Desulfobaccales bacterium]